MPPFTRRTVLLALPLSTAATLPVLPSNAADAPHPTVPALSGACVLPDGQPKVAVTLTATAKAGVPGRQATAPEPNTDSNQLVSPSVCRLQPWAGHADVTASR